MPAGRLAGGTAALIGPDGFSRYLDEQDWIMFRKCPIKPSEAGTDS
jgi:hypothetical protein